MLEPLVLVLGPQAQVRAQEPPLAHWAPPHQRGREGCHTHCRTLQHREWVSHTGCSASQGDRRIPGKTARQEEWVSGTENIRSPGARRIAGKTLLPAERRSRIGGSESPGCCRIPNRTWLPPPKAPGSRDTEIPAGYRIPGRISHSDYFRPCKPDRSWSPSKLSIPQACFVTCP